MTAIVTLWFNGVTATTWRQTHEGLTQVPLIIPQNITILDLSYNDITKLTFSDFIIPTEKMEELWLIGNCIREIEDIAFFRLDNLVLLDLSNNCLEVLRYGMFYGLKSLGYLYLEANKLSSIDTEPFNGLPRPLEISIWENDLACDDGLRQIQKEIDAGTIVIKDATWQVSLVDKFCDDNAPTDDCKCTYSQIFYSTFFHNELLLRVAMVE